jgi:hypothetical protein
LSGPELPLPPRQRSIAASILHLGWAARLAAVYAGSLALGAAVPDLVADSVFLRPLGHGRIELGVEHPVALDAGDGWGALYDGHLVPLGLAIRRQVRIGSRLLDGNIGGPGPAPSRRFTARDSCPSTIWSPGPGAAPTAWPGSVDGTPSAAGLRYLRTTCCGYEQLPQGSRCGDCGLGRTGRS